MPAFHQAGMFRALAAMDEIDLQVIFARQIDAERVALGWQSDTDGYPHLTLDHPRAFGQAFRLAWEQRERLHLMGGLWAESALMAALAALRLSGARYINQSEVPSPIRSRSQMKVQLQHLWAKWVIQPQTGMLAISNMSRDFHQTLGVLPLYTYDFGYFLNAYAEPVQAPEAEALELLYIGQFIERKGVDLLLKAVGDLMPTYPDFSLALIGTGEKEGEARAAASAFPDRIRFEGVMPAEQIRRRLNQAHALILPSRFDGWGVVVNEALSVGVPVIVSDRCGAADLIETGQNGYVFATGSADALRESLEAFLTLEPEARLAMRRAALATGEKISVEVVAPYVVKCLRHFMGESSEKPTAPWKM